MINKKNDCSDLNVSHGEEINQAFVILKELIILKWEYIRKHRLWVTK